MSLPSIAIHMHHNAAVAVYHEGEIACVLELERLINHKNASFEFFEPINSRPYVLEFVYNYLKQAFGYTHYDKFIIGEGHPEFPQRYKDVVPANEYIIDVTHHGAHAASSFYQSPYNKALIASFDGGSNDGVFRLFVAEKGKDFHIVYDKIMDLGSHYHALASVCSDIKNYHALTAAGKLLGLQSYGTVVPEWVEPIKQFCMHIPYWHELDARLQSLSNQLGIPFSKENKLEGSTQYNFARTVQEAFEQLFFDYAGPTIEKYTELPLVITGGCALNITLNTNIKNKYNREVFVAPNSSDCGLPVGLLCKHFKPTKIVDITYKGPEALDKHTLLEYVDHRRGFKPDLAHIVEDLVQDRILGVVQGRSEHGPRALGNRSIICSPLSPNMKDILNAKVKHREWYRPFAPIVRLDDVSEYFEWEGESRWMNFCVGVKPAYTEKLLAVTHVDKSARVQTITREQNPFMYDLLTAFKERTGVGVLVNTSFNVDRKPILSTYKDAFKVFDETQLDRLYLDGFYFIK